MAGKTKREEHEAPPEVPLFWGLTPNQVVAYNLTQARTWKGWTLNEAAEALEPYVGSRWSKANFSAAERSIAGGRIRNFDADEIVAFARAFDLPVTYFFLPPPPFAEPGVPVKLDTPDGGQLGHAIALMIDLVFGTSPQRGLIELRLRAFLDQLGEIGPITNAQAVVEELAQTRVRALVRHSLAKFGRWSNSLHSIANQLEDLSTQSRSRVNEDLDLGDEP